MPLASFEDTFPPLVATVLALLIPIVAMLTYHQRKMAEIMRKDSNQSSLPSAETMQLSHEVAQLREVVSSLAINVDNLKDEMRSNVKIQDRIGVND
jgi:ubiquinone biosynthesis protein UbiJ